MLDDITARTQMLSVRPTQLDDFVAYMVRRRIALHCMHCRRCRHCTCSLLAG